jgi:predicted mannosyl-3-phosphoglycerate phosphatase (HAD superfamily)
MMIKTAHAKQKYPPPEVIYIDVDGTLLKNGRPDTKVVDFARRKYDEGFQIIVWSSRGAVNAIRAVLLADIEDIVSFKLSKPGYIVDDKGWTWTKYTRQIKKL